jgi:nicotinate-nucleotide adenylyltransferase
MDLPAHQGRKIAFFGGSFDPPHRGHLSVARAAQAALGLDSVLFAPVGTQPLKPLGSTASFADRLAMTELAIEGELNFSISLVDAPTTERAHNYTIDTLLRLRAELSPGTELFCLIGADSFYNLRSWHRGAEIPFAASLIVAARPGQRLEDLTGDLPAGLSLDRDFAESSGAAGVQLRTCTIRSDSGARAPLFLLPGLHIDISASEIRRQIQAARGRLHDGHDLLPAPVCDYIATHGLYR